MKKILDRLRDLGVQLEHSSLRRFRLIVSDLQPGSDASALAQHLLGRVLEDSSDRVTAWDVLGREGLRVAKRAGRQDVTVVFAATEPLENGAAGSDARVVIGEALERGHHLACYYVTQVAPKLVGVDVAAELVRSRLRNGDARHWPLRGIFEGLEVNTDDWKHALYDETVAALLHSNSFVAEAAADALDAMNCLCDPPHIEALRNAWTFWREHAGWCERCDLEVTGRSCSKCRTGIRRPNASLLRQLVRCSAMKKAELRAAASSDDHDVTQVANLALKAMPEQPAE